MKAIRIKQFGGPQVMQLTQVQVPEPKPGEVLVKNFSSASIRWITRFARANTRK
ncbi:hypothetical protein VRC34_12760 [Pseudomonas poae]|uniref:hypothetical protein n=1 Tax=Pseudomonas poae TaxID=200451 RepID=UPI0030D2D6E9